VDHDRKRKKTYRANHHIAYANSSQRTSSNSELLDYFKKLAAQSLICFGLFLGILIIQQVPESMSYQGIRGMVLNEIPFSKYNQMYQNLLVNLFPLSYRVPAKPAEFAVPVGGMNGITEEGSGGGISYAASLAKESYTNIGLRDYAEGVLIRIGEAQGIGSFVTGIVIEKSMSENDQIGNFIKIQQANGWIITFGFLEDIAVSRMEYIEIGDFLGIGTQISEINKEIAHYYLAVQNQDGEYVDSIEYLNQLIHEAGE